MTDFIVRGKHDQNTLDQMANCMRFGAEYGVLCADGHFGYAQPGGGVIAYEGHISLSGVGFDIACGNKAVKTSLRLSDIISKKFEIADYDCQNNFIWGRKIKRGARGKLTI